MNCRGMHTLIEENNDKKSIITTKDNFEQDCVNAAENRGIGEREQRTEEFAKVFCGGCER